MGHKQQQERSWYLIDPTQHQVLGDKDEHQQHNSIQKGNLPRLIRRSLPVNANAAPFTPVAFQHVHHQER